MLEHKIKITSINMECIENNSYIKLKPYRIKHSID